MTDVNSYLLSEWEGNPPTIEIVAQPCPGAPYLPLSGGGTARMSPDKFEKQLKDALESKGTCRLGSSHYQVNVWNEDRDDIANQYVLRAWHRFDNAAPYEALFVLYYDAADRVATIAKHMPELLEEYLDDIPAEFV